jgi:hypothetical protein
MRTVVLLLLALQPAGSPPKTLSQLMIDPIYPASDAVFYISTRTPQSDGDWRALGSKIATLVDAAKALTGPAYFRDRDRWMADAKLMIDASAAAADAAAKHDVDALTNLNDTLYTSCVTCHQHYRPNYGRRELPAGAASTAATSAPSAGQSTQAPPAAAAPSRAAMPTRASGADLEGVWTFSTVTPLERPSEFATKPTLTDQEAAAYERRIVETSNRDNRGSSADADVGGAYNEFWWDRGTRVARVNGRNLTSLVVDPADGHIPPLTAEGQRRADARNADRRDHVADGPENRSLGERCLMFNAGPPMLPGPYNNFVQIFQTAGHAIIFNEMIHDARVVPLDGRPHLPAAQRRWQGDSVGHWEGGTLVVDTTNFTDRTNFRGADERLHLVERFTRVDANTLLYEFTIDDPTAFTKPWTVALPMKKTNDRVFEYACHEGNHAMEGILRGARYQEKQPPP